MCNFGKTCHGVNVFIIIFNFFCYYCYSDNFTVTTHHPHLCRFYRPLPLPWWPTTGATARSTHSYALLRPRLKHLRTVPGGSRCPGPGTTVPVAPFHRSGDVSQNAVNYKRRGQRHQRAGTNLACVGVSPFPRCRTSVRRRQESARKACLSEDEPLRSSPLPGVTSPAGGIPLLRQQSHHRSST
jgi:hypothetical protein